MIVEFYFVGLRVSKCDSMQVKLGAKADTVARAMPQ
jgi:hypothetical protein